MKRSFLRSPYLWAIVGVATVVFVAWLGRENYRPVITGADAPDFAYASIDGEEVRLSDFLGEKVVLVNVWATWCGPCVVEMPSMQRLYDSLEGEDFEILAVSVDAPSPPSSTLWGVELFSRRRRLTLTLALPSGALAMTADEPESTVQPRGFSKLKASLL